MKVDVAGEWDVEGNDFGGHIVRHRHWGGPVIAFVYLDPDGDWAECSVCGATLDLQMREQPVGRIAMGSATATD
jgi:hypothetical protein